MDVTDAMTLKEFTIYCFVSFGIADLVVVLLTWRTLVSGPYLVLEHLGSYLVAVLFPCSGRKNLVEGNYIQRGSCSPFRTFSCTSLSEGSSVLAGCGSFTADASHLLHTKSFQISSAEPQSN